MAKTISEEQRKKISESMKGRKLSEEKLFVKLDITTNSNIEIVKLMSLGICLRILLLISAKLMIIS